MRALYSLIGLVIVAALLLWLAKGQLAAMQQHAVKAAPPASAAQIRQQVEADLQKADAAERKQLESADK